MKTEDHERLMTVFTTGHEGVAALIKSILDEAQIKYFAKGEGLQNLFGVGIIGTGFNTLTGPIEFQVMPEDFEYAKELLKDFSEAPSDSEDIKED